MGTTQHEYLYVAVYIWLQRTALKIRNYLCMYITLLAHLRTHLFGQASVAILVMHRNLSSTLGTYRLNMTNKVFRKCTVLAFSCKHCLICIIGCCSVGKPKQIALERKYVRFTLKKIGYSKVLDTAVTKSMMLVTCETGSMCNTAVYQTFLE